MKAPEALGKREAQRLARRANLLDAAELRFAEAGYEGTGLREVTALAGTRLAAVADEFGGKEQLLREVLVRRARPLEAERLQRLESIQDETDGCERLAAIVGAFIDPMLERSADDGWKNYFRFVAQLAPSRHSVLHAVGDEYDRVAFAFIEAFQQACPTAPEEAAHDAYQLMLSSTFDVFAESRRLDHLSSGKFSSTDLERRCASLRTFVTAGVEALLSA